MIVPRTVFPARIVAGIVVFHPRKAVLAETVARVAAEVSTILLFANSPLGEGVEEELRQRAGAAGLHVVGPERNVGLGTAYNTLVRMASERQAEFILLLDQDSTPSAGMIGSLVRLAEELRSAGIKPAIVGPHPVAETGERFKVPKRRYDAPHPMGASAVDFAISSGSLVTLDAVEAIGFFEETFFIDAVDIEWCMRAWSAGWSVWLANDVSMVHRLGQGVIRLPFGLRLTAQPPERLYTYFRNQVMMLRLSHVPASWKAKFIVHLPAKCAVYAMRNRFSGAVLKAIALGLVHGIAKKFGPPQAAWGQIRSESPLLRNPADMIDEAKLGFDPGARAEPQNSSPSL